MASICFSELKVTFWRDDTSHSRSLQSIWSTAGIKKHVLDYIDSNRRKAVACGLLSTLCINPSTTCLLVSLKCCWVILQQGIITGSPLVDECEMNQFLFLLNTEKACALLPHFLGLSHLYVSVLTPHRNPGVSHCEACVC